MPESLTIGSRSSGQSGKRQRSADSREPQAHSNVDIHTDLTPAPLRSSVRIPAYLEKTKSEISSSFQDLEWKQRFRLFHALENPLSSPFRVDRSDIVISRNRYGNVQPWDQSRIKLKTPIGGSDYVNASPIILKRALSSASEKPVESASSAAFNELKYIATQGPKTNHLSHFWYMVHQETTGDVGVIIMLTQCYEANKEKCAIYFPTSLDNPRMVLHHDEEGDQEQFNENSPAEGSDAAASDLDFLGSVTLISADYDSTVGCDVRVLDVSILGMTKRIHHFLFNSWPDFGKPEAEDRIALLNLTRKSYKLAHGSPRIVHCSAGVGRTGTFIALDFLVREIEEGRFLDNSLYPHSKSPTRFMHPDHTGIQPGQSESWSKGDFVPKVRTPTTESGPSGDSDHHNHGDDLIYSTVNTLREQRMMMVMNELQYALLYEIIREVFWNTYSSGPQGASIKTSTSNENGKENGGYGKPPRSKAIKIEDKSDGDGDEGSGSASEAETEIIIDRGDEGDRDDECVVIDGQNTSSSTFSSFETMDPYAAVAPEHIREGIRKESQ